MTKKKDTGHRRSVTRFLNSYPATRVRAAWFFLSLSKYKERSWWGKMKKTRKRWDIKVCKGSWSYGKNKTVRFLRTRRDTERGAPESINFIYGCHFRFSLLETPRSMVACGTSKRFLPYSLVPAALLIYDACIPSHWLLANRALLWLEHKGDEENHRNDEATSCSNQKLFLSRSLSRSTVFISFLIFVPVELARAVGYFFSFLPFFPRHLGRVLFFFSWFSYHDPGGRRRIFTLQFIHSCKYIYFPGAPEHVPHSFQKKILLVKVSLASSDNWLWGPFDPRIFFGLLFWWNFLYFFVFW